MANKSFANLNNSPEISPPEQSPQDITTSFSKLLLSEELSINSLIDNKSNSVEIELDTAANNEIENAVVLPIVDKNIDDKIFDIDLTEIEDISKAPLSKKNSDVKTISTSQPKFRSTGTYNFASASAAVRVVNSPNIVNKSFTKSAGGKPTQVTDYQDVNVVDDLPAIELSEILKLKPKIIPKINKNTVTETESINKLAVDASTSEVISSIHIDSKNHSISKENIDNLNKVNSNIVSEASNDLLIVETDFDENSYFDNNSSNNSIKVNIKNGIVASPGDEQLDNLLYVGKSEHALGDEADDKFFVQSGSVGTDEFRIVNGHPQSADTIVDLEVNNDITSILGSSGLDTDVSTLDFQQVDSNTEVMIKNSTLNVFDASDINNNI